MTKDDLEKQLQGKIKSINKLIPYPKGLKYKLLNNYYKDLQEEITETSKLPTDMQVGSRNIAEKLVKSRNWPIKDASLKKRTFAYLIDIPFSLIFSLVAFYIFIGLFTLYDPKFFQTTRSTYPAVTIFIFSVSTLLYGMVFYFFLLEGLFSTTIGKILHGMIVINGNGLKITWTQAFILSLTKLFPLFLFFETLIGFYGNNDSKRIMDGVADTRVIELTTMTAIDEYIQEIKKKIPNHKKKIEIPLNNLQKELEEIKEAEGKKNPIEIYGSPD